MGIHYCVPRFQNNSESVEMKGGFTIVSPGFWGSKFFNFLKVFISKLYSKFFFMLFISIFQNFNFKIVVIH